MGVIPGAGFAAAIDQRWRAHLGRSGLRDKTLTLTVLKRPETGSSFPFGLGASRARHAADTTRRLRKLDEVVGFLLSSFDELKPRLLAASTGELLGFLGSLNTGEEHPLYAFIAEHRPIFAVRAMCRMMSKWIDGNK